MTMFVELKDPRAIRQMFADKHGWFTLMEIVAGSGMAFKTISAALRGEPIQAATARRIAETLDVDMRTIVTLVENVPAKNKRKPTPVKA